MSTTRHLFRTVPDLPIQWQRSLSTSTGLMPRPESGRGIKPDTGATLAHRPSHGPIGAFAHPLDPAVPVLALADGESMSQNIKNSTLSNTTRYQLTRLSCISCENHADVGPVHGH
jgi:hypothetical protein